MFENLNLVKSYDETNPPVFVLSLWEKYWWGLTSFGQYIFSNYFVDGLKPGKHLQTVIINKDGTYLYTVKILKIGTPEIITIIVLQLEQLDFTVQYCVQKMQTE